MKNKLFTSLFVVLAIFASQACATTGFGGLSVPGYEVNRVVAGNQAMIWSLANSMYGPLGLTWPQVGYFMTPAGQQVVCRPKPKEHQIKDVVGATLVGLGIGGVSAGARGAAYGSAAGAGGGLLYSNHEYDCNIVQPLAPTPAPAPTPPAPPIPPALPPVPPMPTPSLPPQVVGPTPKLVGVAFTAINESSSVVVVEHDNRRLVLKPGGRSDSIFSPNPRILMVQPVAGGGYGEFEVDLRSIVDAKLPGWRITDKVRFISP